MHFVNEDTNQDAWRAAVKLLLKHDKIFNLVLTINNPCYLDLIWFADHNPSYYDKDKQSIKDVVNTIFPYKLLNRPETKDEFYAHYLKMHEKAKRIHRRRNARWGTYFERMIAFGENNINQLDRVIEALNRWPNNYAAALVMHISSPDTDRPRTMGGPCLQYLELLCPNRDTIDLLAVYRNHDYFHKALGNFIGLGHLLDFICNNTGRNPGKLICHSAHAYSQSTKAKLKSLAGL